MKLIIVDLLEIQLFTKLADRQHHTSADLENIGKKHHIQKSLYVSYYMTDFNQTATKIMALWYLTN